LIKRVSVAVRACGNAPTEAITRAYASLDDCGLFIGNANRAAFWYTWNLNEDGTPGLQFWRDFIHRRHGYFWKHMIHEALTRYELTPEISHMIRGMQVFHFQDLERERRDKYLRMLQMACNEDPMADRHSSWLAREYLYAGHTEEAIAEFRRHIVLPTATWAPEVASSMYLLSTIDRKNRLHWLNAAEQKSPERREFKMRLAEYYYHRRDWRPTLLWADRALAITHRPEDYLSEPFAWGSLPHEYRYMALFHLGRLHEAIEAAEQALELAEPADQKRIAANLVMMREKDQPRQQAPVGGV